MCGMQSLGKMCGVQTWAKLWLAEVFMRIK